MRRALDCRHASGFADLFPRRAGGANHRACRDRGQRLLPRSASDLAALSDTAQPENRRMGWPEFETMTHAYACQLHASFAHDAGADMTWIPLWKCRARQSRPARICEGEKPNG